LNSQPQESFKSIGETRVLWNPASFSIQIPKQINTEQFPKLYKKLFAMKPTEATNHHSAQKQTTAPATTGALKKIIKGLLLGASAATVFAFILPKEFYTPVNDSEVTLNIRKKTQLFTKHVSEERVYLQFDKPMYEPGEDIWLAAYIEDGKSLRPSKVSDIVHVELLDPKGAVAKKINLIAHNGKAAGDFSLDEEMPGGMYKVRAYTNWMKNSGGDNYFEKEIQVQDVVLPNLKMKLEFEKKGFGPGDEVAARLQLNTNENQALSNYSFKYVCNIDGVKLLEKPDVTDGTGNKVIRFNLPQNLKSSDGLLNVMISYNGNTESVSRSIPILLNKVDIAFFPEGGNLVNGLESMVAFRSTNEYGKPADIDGVIVTEKGSKVGSFSSFHQGMGGFKLTPQNDEKYFVKITRPVGIKQQYELPAALDSGYILNVDASREGEISAVVNTTENEELSLVAQVRGKIYYSNAIQATKGANKIIFPTENFPAGVTQVTLFDSKGVPQCERLAFVNRSRQLSVTVETEKEKYLPREKVKMNITVKDDKGSPVPANLSMSVVNDQFLSFANSKAGNILSQLLFQQDLKEKIEDPAFYFDKREKKSEKALDYLLMTAGWRQFTWEAVTTQSLPYMQFQPEKAIISGAILDNSSGKPVPNAIIKTNKGIVYKADTNGKFTINHLEMYEPLTLTFSANGYESAQQRLGDYNQNVTAYLYNSETYKQWNNQWNNNNRAWNVPKMAAAGNGVNNLAMDDLAGEVPQAAEMNVVFMNKAFIGNCNGAGHFAVANLVAGTGKANNEGGQQNKAGKKQDPAANGKVLNENKKELERADNNRGPIFRQQAVQPNATTYYRARKFAAPVYDTEEKVETRTDFRNTIYWNPEIEIGKSGKKTIEFYASDDISSFRATIEGVGANGNIGRDEKTFFTQLPFEMSTKIPVEVATEDVVSIPLNLKNNTDGPLGGILTVTAPDGLQELVKIPNVQTIMPGKAKTIFLDYKVLDKIGYGDFTVSFKSCGLGDAFTQKIKIAPKGFPVTESFSGQEKEKEYSFDITNLVNGSIKATVTAYPNVVSDLMKGVEGILREPGGCFEQTSMSAYPNAMVLDYLKSTGSKDDKTIAYAGGLLDRGYKRLVTFETKEKGYEWFGASPGHEGLSAMGIMEFVDMKKAGGDVDQKMIDRTADWILSHKDGSGGFQRKAYALHDFGRISNEIMNAYIVYALAEAGYADLKTEFNASAKKALDTKDPYMLAMLANAAYKMKDPKAEQLMSSLMNLQDKNGSWTGTTHSITYSQGQSLTIETTALGIMAMLKSGKHGSELQNAVKFLVGARSGYGAFSSTQGTILALKALTEYAKFSAKTPEDGTIVVYVDGKRVAEKNYKAGEKNAIVIDGLESKIKGEGKHDIKIKYENSQTPLPYSVAVSWNTSLPTSNKECAVDIKTKMQKMSAEVGETVRLTATITNKKAQEIPSTMAIVGIPAGFTVQPWQLKELQDKKVFDYYETNGNNVYIYYRGMAPSSVKEINLDLKAEMPGEYEAPASSAYLYYTNEFKTWAGLDKITIRKNND
jgi:alpha-2-macroglobulin-like protein